MIYSIIAGDEIIPVSEITGVDISRLQSHQSVIVRTATGEFIAEGFHAVEAVYAVKPSALEGRRLRWRRHAWAFHNTFGHVGLQLLVWMRLPKLGLRWHDYTCPHTDKFLSFHNTSGL